MKLFDSTLNTLSRSLDVRLERQNVLAGNLANSDTPGYRPLELDFHKAMDAMQNELAAPESTTNFKEGHLSVDGPATVAAGAPRPGESLDAAAHPSLDGNAVDVDRTLVGIAENALQYGAATRAVSKKFAILKYVASDGAA